MGRMKTIQKGNGGEDFISYLTHSKIGWNCSKIPVDSGIDLLIEHCDNSVPSGKFIFAQIKTGSSYLNEKINNNFVYRDDKEKISYWLNCSLNVILILFDDQNDTAYWQHISESTIEFTGVQGKVFIPINNIYGHTCATSLLHLFKPNQELINSFRDIQNSSDDIYALIRSVALFSETTDSMRQIDLHVRSFREKQKNIVNRIKDLGNYPKDIDRNIIFSEAYKSSKTFTERLKLESKLFTDSFNLASDAYFLSLITLAKIYGNRIQIHYDVNFDSCLQDLDVLVTNSKLIVSELKNIRTTAKKYSTSKTNVSRNVLNSFRLYQQGNKTIAQTMNELVDKFQNIIDKTTKFSNELRVVLSNKPLIEK